MTQLLNTNQTKFDAAQAKLTEKVVSAHHRMDEAFLAKHAEWLRVTSDELADGLIEFDDLSPKEQALFDTCYRIEDEIHEREQREQLAG